MIQPYDGRAKRPLRKVNHEDATPFYGRIAKGFGWLMRRTSKQDWGPMDAIPQTGPLLVCPNHISNYDPPAIGHFLMWSGRFPYMLAKEEVFKVPFIGWVARGCDMIPVARHSSQAAEALTAAKNALDKDNCIVIYPEGKRTRDPELWPMAGRNGAARLALTTRTPVIPVGQWGAQEVMPPGEKGFHFIPRRTMHVIAGPPVELSDLYSDNPSGTALNEATKRIMDAITTLVVEVRGEPAPVGRWDTRAGARI